MVSIQEDKKCPQCSCEMQFDAIKYEYFCPACGYTQLKRSFGIFLLILGFIFVIMVFSISATCYHPSDTFSSNEVVDVCVRCQLDESGQVCGSDFSCYLTMNYTGTPNVNNGSMSQRTAGDGWWNYTIPDLNNTAGTYDFSIRCNRDRSYNDISGSIEVLSIPIEPSVQTGSSLKETNKTIVCNHVFNFIAEGKNATEIEINNLHLEILREEQMLPETRHLKSYIENYMAECFDLTGKGTSKPDSLFISKQCKPELTSDFIPLDWTLNTLKIPSDISLGAVSCGTINSLKPFVILQEDAPNSYSIQGWRIYPFLLILFIGMFIWLYKTGKIIKRLQKKVTFKTHQYGLTYGT